MILFDIEYFYFESDNILLCSVPSEYLYCDSILWCSSVPGEYLYCDSILGCSVPGEYLYCESILGCSVPNEYLYCDSILWCSVPSENLLRCSGRIQLSVDHFQKSNSVWTSTMVFAWLVKS